MPTSDRADHGGTDLTAATRIQLQPYGPKAWLLNFAEASAPTATGWGQRMAAIIDRDVPGQLREAIPAFRNLLLEFVDQPAPAAMAAWFHRFCQTIDAQGAIPERGENRRTIDLPVCYDGLDLPRIAAQVGGSIDAAIAQFNEASYTVQCLGFSPGFPYLAGLPAALRTPRLAAPRLRVPAGSVAIGGSHAGIYPHPGPGGWNLIGRTDRQLFQSDASTLEEMFPLQPGDRVQFHPVPTSREQLACPLVAAFNTTASTTNGLLQILAVGMGLTLQDSGRAGYRRYGVPAGGAMDPAAALSANRLLENPSTDPVLELCGRGQRFTALRDLWIAVAGANVTSGSGAMTQRLRAGECLEFPAGPLTGVWTYLAVPGGFTGPRCLGSVSSNPRAGLGRVLRPGDMLHGERPSQPAWPTAIARRSFPSLAPATRPLRVWPGPQWPLFQETARQAFFDRAWRVSLQCDRVGYRMAGAALETPRIEMVSEPVLPGSIQVPPDGLPIVTMPDGPTLGGYPKLGIVDPDDLSLLAQSPPGTAVRFQLVG